ncbi:MAG TPA: response regulator [Bryobacteraceae bacterium]|jgi:two-component system, response regulator PdtaR|nr:response regulator [Bryobacteraceae bacterium]
MYRLLLADDDVQQLAIRKLLLEAAGHQVAVAEDEPEALRLLEELRPDVLVMDLRLPKLKDGLSLIRYVDGRRLAAKIIVLSGWTEELCDLPEEKMVCCVLGKPIRNEHLLEAINAAVSSPARSLR